MSDAACICNKPSIQPMQTQFSYRDRVRLAASSPNGRPALLPPPSNFITAGAVMHPTRLPLTLRFGQSTVESPTNVGSLPLG